MIIGSPVPELIQSMESSMFRCFFGGHEKSNDTTSNDSVSTVQTPGSRNCGMCDFKDARASREKELGIPIIDPTQAAASIAIGTLAMAGS